MTPNREKRSELRSLLVSALLLALDGTDEQLGAKIDDICDWATENIEEPEAEPNDERDEEAYVDIADEMNDGSPTDMTLGDFRPAWVRQAERYAKKHGLSWPPEVGDFDRYCEREEAAGR